MFVVWGGWGVVLVYLLWCWARVGLVGVGCCVVCGVGCDGGWCGGWVGCGGGWGLGGLGGGLFFWGLGVGLCLFWWFLFLWGGLGCLDCLWGLLCWSCWFLGCLAIWLRLYGFARLERITLLSALAAVSEHIGLMGTAATSYNEPFNL
ncbi:hypothetical protein RA276_27670, partial [Pseudomonas syringae pv. tagetis]